MAQNQKRTKNLMGIIDKSRFKKLIIVSDNHSYSICEKTEKYLFKVISDFKPDIRIHLGDFTSLDAWRDGASAKDRLSSVGADVDKGLEFIEAFRPDVMTFGNHDWRLWKVESEHNADKSEYARIQINKVETLLKRLGTKSFAWGVRDGVYEIAGQNMVHGYSSGLTSTAAMGRCYGRCVHGHNHTGDILWLGTHAGGIAQSCPSMCDNNKLEYQLGQIAAFKHISGFIPALVDLKLKKYYPGFVIKDGDSFIMMEPKII